MSVTATAVRDLMLGGTDTAYHVAQSLAWCVGILLVFVPLAVRRYRRAVWASPRCQLATMIAARGCPTTW